MARCLHSSSNFATMPFRYLSCSIFQTGHLRESRNEVLAIEWKIDNFLQTTENVANSSKFDFSSRTWYLDLRTCRYAKEWLSLHLCCDTLRGSPQIVEFGLGLKKPDGAPCFQQTFIRKFEAGGKYGINFFAIRSDLVEQKDEKTTSDSVTIVCKLRSITSPGEKNAGLFAGLSGMLSSEKHSDLIINVQDQKFRAHKVILAASSEVFSVMFDHEMSENNSGVLNIKDFEPEPFKDFLNFLYTGKTNINDSNVYDLYSIAHKYRVESLISYCVGYMILHLTEETVCDVATLGHHYSDSDITFAVSEFFEQNVRKVLLTSQWKLLMKNNYLVAFTLLECIASRINVEADVVEEEDDDSSLSEEESEMSAPSFSEVNASAN